MNESINFERNVAHKFAKGVKTFFNDKDYSTKAHDHIIREIKQLKLFHEIINSVVKEKKANTETLNYFLNQDQKNYIKKLYSLYALEIYRLEEKKDTRSQQAKDILTATLQASLNVSMIESTDQDLMQEQMGELLIKNMYTSSMIREEAGPFTISSSSERIEESIKKLVDSTRGEERNFFKNMLKTYKTTQASEQAHAHAPGLFPKNNRDSNSEPQNSEINALNAALKKLDRR